MKCKFKICFGLAKLINTIEFIVYFFIGFAVINLMIILNLDNLEKSLENIFNLRFDSFLVHLF